MTLEAAVEEQLTAEEIAAEDEMEAGFESDPEETATQETETVEDTDDPASDLTDEEEQTEGDTEQQQTQEETATTKEETPAATAAETPTNDVAELRAQIQALQAQLQSVSQFEHRLKSAEGRIGAISAGKLAATAAREAGKEAPSNQTITTAVKEGGQKWKDFERDWPEAAEAMKEFFAANQPQQQHEPVDREEIATEAAARAAQALAEREAQRNRERDYEAIEQKHQGWRTTINTPEFQRFISSELATVSPSPQEIAAVSRAFNEGDADTANGRIKALAAHYPDWAKAGGPLRWSDKVSDAVTLLDAYAAKKARTAQQQSNQQRLKAAAAPKTRGTSGPAVGGTEDDYMNEGFNETKRRVR